MAHANLVRSDPPDVCSPLARPLVRASDPRCATGQVLERPPSAVRLWFSEPVELVARGVTVLSPSGRRVEVGAARASGAEVSVAIEAGEEGTYVVRWRVISAGDSHPARGAFAFSVGGASVPAGEVTFRTAELGSVSPPGLVLQTLSRWLHFAGYALGFGVLAFQLLVLPSLRLNEAETVDGRLRRLLNVGVLCLLLAEPLALLGQTASLGPGEMFDPEVTSDALASSFGRALAQRLGAALLLWVILGAIKQRSRAPAVAALVLGLALALTDGQAAHAASARPVALAFALNAVHVAAMGVWVGGLVALLSVWPALGGPEMAGRRREAARGFGLVAASCLGLLALTGAAQAWLHLATPRDLLASAYGGVLLLKLAVALAAAGAALLARRVTFQRPRWWSLEAAALALVLALAALLVSLPPPR